MLKSWTKILPFFVVEWFIKKHGERFDINTKSHNWDEGGRRTIVRPYSGIYMSINK